MYNFFLHMHFFLFFSRWNNVLINMYLVKKRDLLTGLFYRLVIVLQLENTGIIL